MYNNITMYGKKRGEENNLDYRGLQVPYIRMEMIIN